MKIVLKRIFSILLCVCVFCASFTLTAFAVAPAVAIAFADWFFGKISGLKDGAIDSTIEHLSEFGDAKEDLYLAYLNGFKIEYSVSRDDMKTIIEDFSVNWSTYPEATLNSLISKYGGDPTTASGHIYDIYPTLNEWIMFLKISMSTDEILNAVYGYSKPYTVSDSGKLQLPAKDLKERITEANKLFFPKNSGGKMSYRTDKRWHNKYDGTDEGYKIITIYDAFNGFTAVGGDEMYFVFFCKTADTTYYQVTQWHFKMTKEEKWFEDRDEVEYTYYKLTGEYWDMLEGSSDNATSIDFYNPYSSQTVVFDTRVCSHKSIDK